MVTMTLTMKDETKRTLGNVKHVQALKINLISLGEMVRDGYIFKGHGMELMMGRGSMVCFRGELKNGIYVLKGGICMPTVIVAKEECASRLKLWHRILAHISKRDLQELHKQRLLRDLRLSKLPFL